MVFQTVIIAHARAFYADAELVDPGLEAAARDGPGVAEGVPPIANGPAEGPYAPDLPQGFEGQIRVRDALLPAPLTENRRFNSGPPSHDYDSFQPRWSLKGASNMGFGSKS